MKSILLLSLTICIQAFGQSKAQKDLESVFVNEYCSCLEKFSGEEPANILYDASETCVRLFASARTKEIEQIISERETNSNLSDYEKGRILGKEIVFNAIDELILDCEFYRKTLIEFKTSLIAQLKISKESADSAIIEVKSKEQQLTDDESKATYFSLLAVMYEFVGDEKSALKYYDKSFQIYPTIPAKALRLLLRNNVFKQRNAYGISIGIGNGAIMKQALDGGASYDLNTSISLGFQYSRMLTKKLYIMTSINWYKNTVTVTPTFIPGTDMSPKKYDMQLIYVPLFLRVDLSEYFFISGGPIGDFDITNEKYITSQSGIGAGLGIGTEIPIRDKFAIQLTPYLNFHGLLLADSETYPERILDLGGKLNLIFKK